MKAKILIKFFILFLLLLQFNYSLAQKYIFSGYVENSNTKERLIGVIIEYDNSFFTTNEFGFFNFKVNSADTNIIKIHHIGYKSIEKNILSINDTSIVFQLLPDDYQIEKIIVVSNKQSFKNPIGQANLLPKDFETMPMIGSEVDIFKGMQMLPGVSQSTEGKSDLIIHGGSSDQNLIILDDVPLYYINHIGGFVSIFNINMIKNVELYKSSFPAKYGGRLSSVIDIRAKDGDMHNFKYSFTISPITSSIFLEGPIKKDKISFVLGYRRTFLDLFTVPYTYFIGDKDVASFYFYDINFKINFKLSNNNKIFFSFYKGDDRVNNFFKDVDEQNYSKYIHKRKIGNTIGSIRWNTNIMKIIFSNTTFALSKFRYITRNEYFNRQLTDTIIFNSEFNSSIFDIILKNNTTIYFANFYKINIGFDALIHHFEPANFYSYENTLLINSIDSLYSTNYKSEEYEFYLENKFNINKTLFFNFGLRYNQYGFKSQYYKSFQPRASVNLIVSKWLSVKASYSKTQQNIHLINFTDIGGENALWLPATELAPPELAQQIAFGTEIIIFKHFNILVDGYYKKISNLLAFEYGTIQDNAINWENNSIKNGIGKSYGVEFIIKVKRKKFSTWLAYTYSKTTRQFDKINQGKEYLYDFDKPHDIETYFSYNISDKIDFSLSWTFQSGRPISLPVSIYETIDGYNNLYNSDFTLQETQYFNSKNSFRMRPYHRLDFAISFKKIKNNHINVWSINIYNVYNRQNPYFYFFDTDTENGNTVKKLYQQSLFPIIPSISYSFKF